MLGLINKIMRQALIEDHGEALWQQILSKQPDLSSNFDEFDQYPDSSTSALVSQASEILGIPKEQLLVHLGQRWIELTSTGDYSDYYKIGGQDIFTFLSNLDHMHATMGKTFASLSPPSFEVDVQCEGLIHLVYKSCRPGLDAFVIGLLNGLTIYFDQPADIQLLPKLSQPGKTVFAVKLKS